MTLVVGWLHNGKTFLAADSALSGSFEPTWGTSSFGERANKTREGDTVEEGISKLVHFDNVAAAAFCGDVEKALAFLEELRPHVRQPDLPRVLAELGARLDTQHAATFSVLVARADELVSFVSSNPARPRKVPIDEVVVLGSAPEPLAQLVRSAVEKVQVHSPDDQLVLLIATLQMAGLQNQLFEDGIGGTFFGCSIDREGVRWMDDTLFFVVPPEVPKDVVASKPPRISDLGIQHVLVICREGSICRTSSFMDAEKEPAIWVLVPELTQTMASTHRQRRWLDRWSEEVRRIQGDHSVRYLALVSNAYPHLMVADLKNNAADKFLRRSGDQAAFNGAMLEEFQAWRPSLAEPHRFLIDSDRARAIATTPSPSVGHSG